MQSLKPFFSPPILVVAELLTHQADFQETGTFLSQHYAEPVIKNLRLPSTYTSAHSCDLKMGFHLSFVEAAYWGLTFFNNGYLCTGTCRWQTPRRSRWNPMDRHGTVSVWGRERKVLSVNPNQVFWDTTFNVLHGTGRRWKTVTVSHQLDKCCPTGGLGSRDDVGKLQNNYINNNIGIWTTDSAGKGTSENVAATGHTVHSTPPQQAPADFYLFRKPSHFLSLPALLVYA